MALSKDLRQRVIEMKAENGAMTQQELAQRFRVSQSSVSRWLKRYQKHQELSPGKPPGRNPILTPDDLEFLKQASDKQRDATLSEHAETLKVHRGKKVSPPSIMRALDKLKLSRKKNSSTIPRKTPLKINKNVRPFLLK